MHIKCFLSQRDGVSGCSDLTMSHATWIKMEHAQMIIKYYSFDLPKLPSYKTMCRCTGCREEFVSDLKTELCQTAKIIYIIYLR